MQRLERRCTCNGDDGECPVCTQWAEQQSFLHNELQLKPWQWPVYERPDEAEPSSPRENADAGGPVARYRALKQAARRTGAR